uniref:Chromosome 4 open reading frame 50 n=1 Tax=Lynx canadensis TaxID=61383 RepID=A0A667G8B2_LYNCA
MEPAARGRTEKSFSYVVRAPGSDGFDEMNVDVKIDTCWVFQDVEDGGEGPGCLPAAGSPDTDAGVLRKQLESSEQKLLAAVDRHVMSESRLRSRIQELELSERQLLQSVDQLNARVLQERSDAARAQEKLQALRDELASQVLEKERAARRQRWRLRRLRERLRRKDEALGRQAAALERCRGTQRRQLALVREQERGLREQVRRLERDVRRLCHAAGLLLAELDAPAARGPRALGPAGPGGEAEELRALQARAERGERERDEAARRLREQRATERRLRGQLEDLRCCIYELKLSEIGLQGQVEDLAQQNRSLREELGAQAPGESARSPASGLEERPQPGAAGQSGRTEPSCPSQAPLPPSSPSPAQPRTPAEPSLDAQTFLLICGCPPGQYRDGSLLPVELAGISEQRLAAAQVLVQTSTLPPWGPAGDPPSLPPLLLLRESSPQESQMRRMLDARFPPAPRAGGPTCRDPHWRRGQNASLCHEPPQISSHKFKSPRDVKGAWKEGGGPPEWRTEEQGARRSRGRKEADLGDESKLSQESRDNPSLGDGVRAPEGEPVENGASETQASVSCPWPRPKLPWPLLQEEASVSTEGPAPLSRRWREGGLSSPEEEEAPPARTQGSQRPSPGGTQLLAGQGEEETLVWSANAPNLQEESPGDQRQGEKEEKAPSLEGSCLAHRDIPGEPGPEEREHQETLSPVAEGGLTLSPRSAFPPRGTEPTSDPWALSQQPDRSELRRDEFGKEAEASSQQLSILQRGGGGRWWPTSTPAGGSKSLARKQHSPPENAHSQQALANQGSDICLAREVRPGGTDEEVGPGGTEVLGTSTVLPGMVPDSDDVGPGPEWPSELGGNQPSQPLRALEEERRRFHQLISGLKRERSQVLRDNAELRGDRERCRRKVCALEEERERNVTKMAVLEQDNSTLVGDIALLKRELAQYRQVVSDLEDCNGKSYGKISELEEENEQLKGRLAQLQRAMAESARKSKGVMEHVTMENRELKALISELGVSYKELMKGVVLGIEDTVQAFRGENAHLLSRLCVLETEVALGASTAGGRLVRAEEGPQGESKMVGGKEGAVERGVQVTQLSGQLTAEAHGPPLEEKPGLAGRWMGPSLRMENSRNDGNSAASSLVGGSAEVSSAPRGNIDGAGAREARLEKEEKRPWCSADPGRALRASNGPQVDTPKEDLRLCIGHLQHQVLTLRCQLRDQASAHRVLQVSHGEATRLRDQLKGELEELQRKQHEANSAVAPLKAKLASLVQKCRERNRLITHLLRELHRRGAEDPLLSETARGMVADVALAEYAATFLAPALPEVVSRDPLTLVLRGLRAHGFLSTCLTRTVPPSLCPLSPPRTRPGLLLWAGPCAPGWCRTASWASYP